MNRPIFNLIMAAILFCLVSPGCTHMKETFSDTETKSQTQPSSRYLAFNDILVPGFLTNINKETYITNGHGRLVLSGRVEGESLSQFFMTSMYSDGWIALNQYTFQGSIKLYFKKNERISSILISENPLGTRVEIWVVPQGKI